jgi:tetratricopeptide (TPR) repeat protein
MNKMALWFLILTVFSCNQNTAKKEAESLIKSNEELKGIYQADQADRKSANINWSEVSERDKQRQKRVYKLLDSNLVRTSEDYANAAMVFQHGDDTIASGMAVKLMRKAIELDSSRSKWLLAAAIDRDLMRRKEPQIYGTQYIRMGADEPWQLYELDSTKITDEERKVYGVETLSELREKLKMMNKKKLTERLESGQSIDDIIKHVKSSDLYNSDYDLSESALNSIGYQLMGEEKNEDALKIFKLNTELYPDGFNTYDSYGECLVKLGKIKEGIVAYKKSLELNPNNDSAKKVLAEIEK